MRVKMRVQISGTRDAKDWPAPGTVVDLPDAEALSLLAQNSALPVVDEKVETATPPTDTVESRETPVVEAPVPAKRTAPRRTK